MNRSELTAAVRRRLPASTVGARARLGAALDARDGRTMDEARRSMDLLLGAVRPDVDLDPFARRYLRQMRWANEARWHPDVMAPLRVEGLERLGSQGDGGVLVSFLHHGPFAVVGVSLAACGREVHVMANPDICEPRRPWQRQIRDIASRDCTLFSTAEGSTGVRSRLERGLVVVVASDVPGRTPVRFLGRDLVGSSGAVRTAWAAGVPVVACTTRLGENGRPYYRLEEPQLPGTHATPEALLQTLLGIQEEPVLAWPEGYYDPLTKWSTDPHLPRGSS